MAAEAEDMRKRFSVVLAVEDVGKKADETDLSTMINAAETDPAPEGTFKERIENLEVRVQDLNQRLEFLPQYFKYYLKYFFSVLNQVKGFESWTASQIVNHSYKYYQELEPTIKEAQDVLQDLQKLKVGREQELLNSKNEVAEVMSIQQAFLQLLEQKETARAKLLTLNRAKLCWNCHSTENLLMCEDCMRAKYCSEECQEDDRDRHQDWCDQMKQRREERRKAKRNE